MRVRDDRRRGQAIGLFLVAFLAIAVALGTGWYAQRMNSHSQMVRQNLSTLRARIATVDPGAEGEYEARLHSLQLHQVVGEESRLSIIEDVEAAARDARLTEMRYELGARGSLGAIAGSFSTPAEASSMKLTLRLQQPDQLSIFLDRLKTWDHGLYWTRKCVLRLPGDASAESGIEADCELLWITVKSPTTLGGTRGE